MNPSYIRILAVVKLIPQGNVASYGQIADLAGLPKQSRLVSKALKSTSDSNVPWHRVINSQGKISIPAGDANHRLQISLLLEDGIWVKNSRVDFKIYGWQPSLDILLHKLSY